MTLKKYKNLNIATNISITRNSLNYRKGGKNVYEK